MELEAVIGLEIHTQLLTATKIFCGCRAQFGGQPNTQGCPVCLGLPGSLPVLNRKVVDMAILTGLACGCSIEKKSIFARKNYLYPDLPKGYQISQYDKPLCLNGSITINDDGVTKKIGITRIHLEEDAGKLIHDQDVDTLFDVNRCGTPLMEIVSEPDIRTPREAYLYVATLKRILEYLGVSDCNMEEASLRCDANISIRVKGETKLGTKTELKNMNSLKGIEKALEYECMRQKELLAIGESIHQQTFQWDPHKNITIPMRSKEDAQDYRYFPDPDLLPLLVEESWIEEIRSTLPELPEPRYHRFIAEYGLNQEHVGILTANRHWADYFEQTLSFCSDSQLTANWIMSEILRLCKEKKVDIHQLFVTPGRLGQILKLIKDGTISANAAKKVLIRAETDNQDPLFVVDKMGLRQISDTATLESTVKTVLAQCTKEVKRYQAGEQKLKGFFIGQTMKATKGKGNPKEINRILDKLLKE